MEQFNGHPLYRKHDLDSAMSSLWSFYIKNFAVLFLVSLAASLLIQFITSTLDMSKLTSLTDPYEMLAELKNWIFPMLGVIAISLIMILILQYYIIFKPVRSDLNLFTAFYKSMKHLLPYLLLMILFLVFATVAMVAGILVFVIGMFFAALYVYMIGLFLLPVLMVEGNDPGKAIARTFTLSHRHFGPNLGYTAIILLIILVGSIILSSLILIPFSGSFFKIISDPAEASGALNYLSNPWFIILSALANAIFTPLTPILAAILYFNARAREEEADLSRVSPEADEGKVRVEDLYARPYSEDHPDNPDRENPAN
ncbi:MAG TPA: hypothetical protein PLV06_00950 [Bacteroidales bacterium]|nr:hypothetical protein [Bacteroidales bacterium]HPJ59612.1 hypothetical protein [Bacteroidales bacterium]HPR10925.1 hypothetical protein [Bacteroidales bacterium]HRW84114.1 hypothetical protein [Bacteroidales bacterium]